MWITTCSSNSKLHREHHDVKTARQDLLVHILGSKALGWDEKWIELPPCNGEHTIEDDGNPCDWLGCKKPYVRKDGRYQYVV